MPKETKPSVAVLGIGLMGRGIAGTLQRNGFPVHAWDRNLEKASKLANDGIRVFESASDAAKTADAVITILTDADVVMEVMESVPDLPRDTLWLQLSTVGIESDRLAEFASLRGLAFVDAPVQGTRQPAEQGKLVILASGSTDAMERARPIFEAIGQRTIFVSDRAGDSSRLKLALNSYVFALTHGTAEMFAIARNLGVDPGQLLDAVTGGALDSPFFQAKAAAIVNSDFTPSFSIDNAIKDYRLLFNALAPDIEIDLARAGFARFKRVSETGHGSEDMAASVLAS